MSIKSFLINGVEHHCDYNELENIPEINGVLLKGKLTTEELGIKDGKEGPQGEPGAAGADGYSPTVTVTTITGGHRVTITDANGAHTFDVMDGEDGEGSSITVDSALSDSSTNPVQNKVVKKALDGKGTYSKPSGGIPKSDFASAVQTSLDNADTALQSVPSTYRTAAAQDTIDAGKIDKPSNPATGAFLVWNGSAWAAQTLATWQGGSF